MELQPVSRQMSLLSAEHDNGDLAAVPPLAPTESANFYVERPSILETAGVVALIATAAALGVWFIAFVHSKLASEENSYTQLWLLFTLMAPLTYMYNIAFRRAVLLYEKIFWVRVELDSMKGKALYNAVSFAIEEVAQRRHDTASADMLGTAEFDRKIGRTLVHLSYWSSRPKTVRLQIRDAQLQLRKLRVDFECGADIVCGRDNSVQNRGSLVLRLAASGDLLADKRILSQWLDHCLTAYQSPANDVVEVIALDESSRDWVMEWKVRCVRPKKRTKGVGHEFFLKRSCSKELLSDACTWFGQSVRCYLITGHLGPLEDGAYDLAGGLPQASFYNNQRPQAIAATGFPLQRSQAIAATGLHIHAAAGYFRHRLSMRPHAMYSGRTGAQLERLRWTALSSRAPA